MQQLICSANEHNQKMWESLGPSGDEKLDQLSWDKTKKEFAAGTLIGPFDCPEDLPVGIFRMLKRFPIWEQHGGAEEPTCQNIDDCLAGGQNDSVGLQYTNRPANQDAWASLNRCSARSVPSWQVSRVHQRLLRGISHAMQILIKLLW